MGVKEDGKVGIFIDCHCVIWYCLVELFEKVVKDNFKVFRINVEVGQVFINRIHLAKRVKHYSADLLLWHWAEVEVREMILIEDISGLFEYSDFLD